VLEEVRKDPEEFRYQGGSSFVFRVRPDTGVLILDDSLPRGVVAYFHPLYGDFEIVMSRTAVFGSEEFSPPDEDADTLHSSWVPITGDDEETIL
jgi:hypothetical protein